jgi:fibronectin type 3 domain-containing protein
LSWTASTTPNVTYNVYRATAATGPFTTPLNSSPITGTTYTDTTVQAGQTYYYVATAVANGIESADSSPPVPATIPSP